MPETRTTVGAVESLLRHDSLIVAGALLILVVIAGLYTVAGVGMYMSAIDMTRMAGPLGDPMDMAMQPQWSLGYFLLVFLMWWVMMIAMMTPSAAPLVLLFTSVKRMGPEQEKAASQSMFLLAGYLVAWAGFSAVAAMAQWLAANMGFVDGAMMTIETRWFAGFVLVAAGLYQFTPIKTACLKHCRAPGQFLAEHNRRGSQGAFRMGLDHGTFCLGCCWALMALLFVGGIMNLWWIAGLAGYVLIEKFVPRGDLIAKLAGAGLMLVGAALLISA